MATTQTHPPETEHAPPQPRRRGPILAAAIALAVVAAAILGIALLVSGNDEEPAASPTTVPATTSPPATAAPAPIVPGTPEAFTADFVAAARNGGIEIPDSVAVEIATPWHLLLEWNLALGIEPQFSDCRAAGDATTTQLVTCAVAAGDAYFHSRVAGEEMTSFVTGSYSNALGSFVFTGFPAPDGLVEIEEAFRDWIRTTHPDEESRLFGNDYAGVVKFTEESGALHMQYLDEYLLYLASPLSPEDVMARLIATVQAIDAERFAGLTAPLDPMGRSFLEWNAALGMDPVFSGCAESSNIPQVVNFTCAVTMGEGYFFSVVAGENVTTSVNFTISTGEGTLGVGSWPPPRGLVETERAFRDWIVANHAGDEERMFGNDYAGVVRFSAEAGELHMQYLDEYLSYIEANG
jgi:hypothetical protein